MYDQDSNFLVVISIRSGEGSESNNPTNGMVQHKEKGNSVFFFGKIFILLIGMVFNKTSGE